LKERVVWKEGEKTEVRR